MARCALRYGRRVTVARTRRRRYVALLALLGAIIAAAPAAAAPTEVVAYWGTYSVYDRAYFPKDLPMDRLTAVDVDGAYPSRDGRCTSDAYAERRMPFTAAQSVDGRADPGTPGRLAGIVNQLRLLKARHPKVRLLITIAQLDPAKDFARAAATPASRTRFVRSCIDRYIRGRYPGVRAAAPGIFDGIDLDWELPHGARARHDFTLLVREFRRQLDAVRPRLLLTAAIGADSAIPASFELGPAARSLDWIGVMDYELHGTWNPRTTFNAPLRRSAVVPDRQTVANSIAMYRRAGVPAAKILMGVPFYGHVYADVPAGPDGTGLDQPYGGLATGPGIADGDIDYRTIATGWLPGLGVHRDAVAAQASVYDPATRRLAVFDDPVTLGWKAAWARAKGLRGAMIWEISQDTPDGALLGALDVGLRG